MFYRISIASRDFSIPGWLYHWEWNSMGMTGSVAACKECQFLSSKSRIPSPLTFYEELMDANLYDILAMILAFICMMVWN